MLDVVGHLISDEVLVVGGRLVASPGEAFILALGRPRLILHGGRDPMVSQFHEVRCSRVVEAFEGSGEKGVALTVLHEGVP